LNGQIFKGTINMKFVNMTNHIIEMAISMIDNMISLRFDPSNTRNKEILFEDQMFCSGKFRIGLEFIGQVREHFEEIKKEVEARFKSSEKLDYAINILNYLSQSKTYRFEFETLLPAHSDETVLSQLAKGLKVDIGTLMTHFDSESSCSYFLHIDEMNSFEIDQVYLLWTKLRSLQIQLLDYRVFLHLYFSGKRTLFNLFGSFSERSPILVKWLILHALQEKYVKEIVQDIISKNQFSVSDIDYFSKQLYFHTAGVPRLIEFVLHVLTKTNAYLEIEEEIDQVLDEICFDSIVKHAPDSQKFKIDSPILQNIAIQLLLASQMGIKLNTKDKLEGIDPDTGNKKEDTVKKLVSVIAIISQWIIGKTRGRSINKRLYL